MCASRIEKARNFPDIYMLCVGGKVEMKDLSIP
jgi:hypothetical protein